MYSKFLKISSNLGIRDGERAQAPDFSAKISAQTVDIIRCLCHNLDPFLRREGARVRATLCNSVQWRSARDV